MSMIPEGFAPLALPPAAAEGFLGRNGPLYTKWVGDRLRLGFRVEERHCNVSATCHGGMMAFFADTLLPTGARAQFAVDPGFLPTINLTCDFIAPAPLGAWVEGQVDLLRTTRSLMFTQALAWADDVLVMRANAVSKIRGNGAGEVEPRGPANLFSIPKR